MQKILISFGLLLIATLPAIAQESPKYEVFGGSHLEMGHPSCPRSLNIKLGNYPGEREKFFDGFRLQILARAQAYGDAIDFLLAIADDQHERNLL